MYKHILVPLDQSDLAETALPHAEAIARAMKARLSIVVVSSLPDPNGTARAAWEAEIGTAGEYLKSVCSRFADEKLLCASQVIEGDIAEEIVRYAQDHDCDLIVMATHGRPGRERWVHGSVAEAVLATTAVPVLMVRAPEE
ncbi:MAG TPA: universal stress protein [Armatimonadota bacterium]|jgi:nucleotide-binding universal stress UspA family protein